MPSAIQLDSDVLGGVWTNASRVQSGAGHGLARGAGCYVKFALNAETSEKGESPEFGIPGTNCQGTVRGLSGFQGRGAVSLSDFDDAGDNARVVES